MSTFRATHIVSLGGNCRVTYNLRKHFNFGSAYPFDWWICPLKSATSFLSNPNLDVLYDPLLLAPVMQGDRIFSIENSHFGIRLHHEFPRKQGTIISEFREHVGAPRQRLTYLFNKFLKLNTSDSQILFVRNFINWDRDVNSLDVIEFMETVRKSVNAASTEFLFINPPRGVDIAGVRTLRFSDPPPDPWQGDQAVWSENLSKVDVDFVNLEGSRFVETGPEMEKKEMLSGS